MKKLLIWNALISIITTMSIVFFVLIFLQMNDYVANKVNSDGKYDDSFLMLVLYISTLATMIVSGLAGLVVGLITFLKIDKEDSNNIYLYSSSITTMMFGLAMIPLFSVITYYIKNYLDKKKAEKETEQAKAEENSEDKETKTTTA